MAYVHDGRYFVINRLFMKGLGLWPYQNPRIGLCLRTFAMVTLGIALLPQINSVCKNYRNIDRVFENVPIILFVCAQSLKMFAAVISQEKLKGVLDTIDVNWEKITDPEERKILVRYFENGRFLNIAYLVYIIYTLLTYIMFPLIPILLDIMKPLPEKRPLIFILNGELPFDSQLHYKKIFLFDALASTLAAYIIVAIDTTYAACIEHSLGLFAIVKYRLENCTKYLKKYGNTKSADITYNLIRRAIQLHNEAIQFVNIIDSCYSLSFLFLVGINVLIISVTSVLAIIKVDDMMECSRQVMILVGLQVHLLFLSWPSQKLIDHSNGLVWDSYNNEWYECSIKSQKALQLLAVRAGKRCSVNAGGIMEMNFGNFLMIVKTSVSYMTLLSSFR